MDKRQFAETVASVSATVNSLENLGMMAFPALAGDKTLEVSVAVRSQEHLFKKSLQQVKNLLNMK
jgi:DNA primase